MIIGGSLSLALIVGTLIAGAVFTRPAAAASKQQQVALTGSAQRLEVVTTVNGQVEHQWSDDNGTTWSGLVSLGEPAGGAAFFGAPTAVSDGGGRLNVFATSTGGGILQKIDNNGQWSTWNPIPGEDEDGLLHFGSCGFLEDCVYAPRNPAVTSWGPGRLDLFAYAYGDGDTIVLLHTWADNYQWSGTWEVLGTGLMQGAPTAVSWGPGRIDVFVQGGGNELDHKWFTNAGWSSGWENLGGALTSSPSVASPRAGSLNVYARGSNGDLWTFGYAITTGWSGWIDVGCCLASLLPYFGGPVAAVSPGLDTVDVFVIGLQGALYGGVYNVNTGWAPSHIIDSTIVYSSIGTATWFPGTPPPPPPTPTHTPQPTPTLTRCQPPCVLPK